jgi:hypothetical protein
VFKLVEEHEATIRRQPGGPARLAKFGEVELRDARKRAAFIAWPLGGQVWHAPQTGISSPTGGHANARLRQRLQLSDYGVRTLRRIAGRIGVSFRKDLRQPFEN